MLHQDTQQWAQQVWANTAKAKTRGLAGVGQGKGGYSLALVQLGKQRGVALAGAPRELVAGGAMSTRFALATKAGALPGVLGRSRVMGAGCAQPARNMAIGLCAGRQPMWGLPGKWATGT